MKLSHKQVGVLKGMLTAMALSILVIAIAVVFDPFSFAGINAEERKLTVLGFSLILPTLFLIISIGRLARHRFFSPEDIDGSALSSGTKRATLLQSLLQNTLEQFILTVVVYLIWALTMPVGWLSVLPLNALLFAIGRFAFFVGYKNGAPARAFGFALTFYPTALLMLILIAYQLAVFLN